MQKAACPWNQGKGLFEFFGMCGLLLLDDGYIEGKEIDPFLEDLMSEKELDVSLF